MDKTEQKLIKKITLGIVFGWFLGLIFLLSFLFGNFTTPPVRIAYLLSGLIIFPPSWNKIKDLLKFDLSGIVKFFVVIGIFVITSSLRPLFLSDQELNTLTTTKTNTTITLSPTLEQEIFKIGDAIQRGVIGMKVNSKVIDWHSSNQFDKPRNPGDVFVVVNVTLVNHGTNDLRLSGFWDFKLEDANGVQRSEAISAGIGLNKLSGESMTALSPEGIITGDLLFAVPDDATDYLVLHYKPLASFGKPAKIELQ
ncbi:MAG: hypothetical protein UV73_C0011G0037 [Candidatus Gottesmanbacteria bacterium GW2011_GWA2_43_14]|uniref:DUF4352 domain-containing protein n=1 Tax=Candidatus Gottesmanbacteria bacterium GW2011_GWA2_43_14 TaxID=1618443 RepID=A0A0G1DEN6_9BACT|nr:MAG: hypothetical protein UV73_C0011G0037 [Candidatus Gottesmanbacteria bacterium GW2011_GWA2_43_14]